jgi:hypothetical protein
MRINLAIELTAKLQPLFKYIIPDSSIGPFDTAQNRLSSFVNSLKLFDI